MSENKTKKQEVIDVTPYQEFARDRLGIEFNDISLLVEALTHRSYVNEHRENSPAHNERLEFLGDAVLELITSDYLFRTFNESEGILTALRSALVRTESICAAGHELGYEPLVRLSKGEQNGVERAHEVIFADCFEAVVGAIYLDQGYEVAKDMIYKHIIVKIDEIIEECLWRDPKSYAQELAQKLEASTPVYHTLYETGPDHDKYFEVGFYVNDDHHPFTTGEGHSKQEAQTKAALAAIKIFREKYGDDEVGIIHKITPEENKIEK